MSRVDVSSKVEVVWADNSMTIVLPQVIFFDQVRIIVNVKCDMLVKLFCLRCDEMNQRVCVMCSLFISVTVVT